MPAVFANLTQTIMNIRNFVLSTTLATLLTTPSLAPGNYAFEFDYTVSYDTGFGQQETMALVPSATGGAVIGPAVAQLNESAPGQETDIPPSDLALVTSQATPAGVPVLWFGTMRGTFTVSTAGTLDLTGQLGGDGDTVTVNGRLRIFALSEIVGG